jgi:hypothetical protein
VCFGLETLETITLQRYDRVSLQIGVRIFQQWLQKPFLFVFNAVERRKMFSSSEFECHEACPSCGSRDNLGRWKDGHAWCFGCGYGEPPSRTTEVVLEAAKAVLGVSKQEMLPSKIRMPEDAVYTLGFKAQQWLLSYGITSAEAEEHNLKWSQKEEQLLFPIYDDENLIAYQARNFKGLGAAVTRRPKWVTYGKVAEIVHILGLTNDERNGIVLVEDMVSAIKCSRYMAAMPLFGNDLSAERMRRLLILTDKLVFWLDPDMQRKSTQLATQAKELGFKPLVVHTNCDPKEEPPARIKQMLLENN